nr:MAG TPA_asm: hypothetical protein [Caudoviricetes sp.]
MVICCGSASIWNELKTFWVNSAGQRGYISSKNA